MFCFRDVRMTEIKLQLNYAAGGRLRRNKILFYSDVRTSWNWNKTKLSTVGWNEVLFFFSSFISRCATGFRLLRYTVGSSSMECLLRWQRDSTLTTSITNVFRHSGVFGIRHFLYVGTSITALVLLRKWGGAPALWLIIWSASVWTRWQLCSGQLALLPSMELELSCIRH